MTAMNQGKMTLLKLIILVMNTNRSQIKKNMMNHLIVIKAIVAPK